MKREEQTLDDKRVDLTISYGFIGSILIELKLAHSNDAKTGEVGKKYIKTLNKYISGTNSDYGIFLIFNIRSTKEIFDKQMQDLSKQYEEEHSITIMGINCNAMNQYEEKITSQ